MQDLAINTSADTKRLAKELDVDLSKVTFDLDKFGNFKKAQMKKLSNRQKGVIPPSRKGTLYAPYKLKPKYNKDVDMLMLDYFSVDPYHMNKQGKLVANDYPTIVKFCDKYNVDFWQFKTWLSKKNDPKYKTLHATYDKCKELALNFLLVNAQKKLIDPLFTQFCLKNLYQWTDRSDTRINVQQTGYATMVRRLSEARNN